MLINGIWTINSILELIGESDHINILKINIKYIVNLFKKITENTQQVR